jgi:predicted phosphodiesterase
MTEQNWENLAEELLKPVEEKENQHRAAVYKKLPTGSEPGIVWDGATGELRTGVLKEAPSNWDDLIKKWGEDPEIVEIIEPVQVSKWEAQGPEGEIVQLSSYKAKLRSKVKSERDFDFQAILDEFKTHKPAEFKWPEEEVAYVHCTSDTQIGKDDPKELLERFFKSVDNSVIRLKQLRFLGNKIGAVYLIWPGDCIEGVKGNYASQQFTVKMNQVEMVRLFRRMLTYQVKAFAGEASRVVVIVVPGNHDEASRDSRGKNVTNGSDSWAIEGASILNDILRENPETYGHVSVVVPQGNGLGVSVDICGTPVGVVHGHQFPPGSDGWRRWWANQAHGCQDIGNTTLLLAGHKHHLKVEKDGAKSFIQMPCMDSGSQWWTDKTGIESVPGTVTMTVGQGNWDNLRVL